MPIVKATLAHGRAAPTTTRVEIVPSNGQRTSVTLTNLGAVTVYLGGPNVSTANAGATIEAGQEWRDEDSGAAWYGITASGTGDVGWFESSGGT